MERTYYIECKINGTQEKFRFDNKRSFEKYLKDNGKKVVVQLDMKGKYISSYPSAVHAAEAVGVSRGNIWSSVKGKAKTSGGYKWVYEEDYEI